VRELQTGLWHWQAPHPGWESSEPWDQEVSSYAIDDGTRLLLFDPLGVPNEIEELAADREPVIVLTCPWHERDTQSLVERLGVPVFAPAPETRKDLMEKFGRTAEEIPHGSPDLAWLKAADALEKHWISAGDRLPVGVEVFPGKDPKDLVLWIESQRRSSPAIHSSTSARASRSTSGGYAKVTRARRSPRRCARCSSCRSSSCSPRAGRPPTEPPSSERWPRSRSASRRGGALGD
jgi:hypothetical protein